MSRYGFSVAALIISVAGVGVSLVREEFRCYLGLSSEVCDTSEIKSPYPTTSQPILNQETVAPNPILEHQFTPENSQQQTPSKIEKSKTKKLEFGTVKNQNTSLENDNQEYDDKFISVEELSRMPENSSNIQLEQTDQIIEPKQEEYVGIPIEVQPYQEP